MSEIYIAANYISATGSFNFGHLQIVSDVAGSLMEIEVQAPLNEFWDELGMFGYPPVRDHVDEEYTQYVLGSDGYDPDKYKIVKVDLADRDPGDVWELLVQIHEYFQENSFNFTYSLLQNSNSYAATLLWMVGIDAVDYFDRVRPADVTGGFPGMETNIVSGVFVGPTIDFDLTGTDGKDVLQTGNGDDTFVAGGGDDEYFAGAGNDILVGDKGADILAGGSGTDTADYSGTVEGADTSGTQGVAVQINTDANGALFGNVFDNWGDYDTLNSVEKIVGTNRSDDFEIHGDAADAFHELEQLDAGGQGANEIGDTLDLSGHTGTSTLIVNLNDFTAKSDRDALDTVEIYGFENIIGSDRRDILVGDAGDNIIEGGGGGDTIDGGDGIDFITFNSADVGVEVDLVDETGLTGDAEGDEYSNVEGVTGSEFDDIFWTETALESKIAGGDGQDVFNIHVSSDPASTPTVVWGGAGADDFYFHSHETLGIMAVSAENLTLDSFQTFDVSMLDIGDVDWSQVDVILLNPDDEDEYFYGYWEYDQMGVSTVDYDVLSGWQRSRTYTYDPEVDDTIQTDVYSDETYQTVTFDEPYSTDTSREFDTLEKMGDSLYYPNPHYIATVASDFDVSFLGNVGTVFGDIASAQLVVKQAVEDFNGNDHAAELFDRDPASAMFIDEVIEYYPETDASYVHNYYYWIDYRAFDGTTWVYYESLEEIPVLDTADNYYGLSWYVAGARFDGTDLVADGSITVTLPDIAGSLNGDPGGSTFAFSSGDGASIVTGFDPGRDTLSVDGVTISNLASLPIGVIGQASVQGYVLSYGAGDTILIETTPELEAAYPELFSTGQVITGTTGRDTLVGGDGNDQIDALGDNDQLFGGAGNDVLTSASGNNSMFGQSGNDTLVAGTGHDQLTGGTGDDSLTGGSGRNTFHFATGDGLDVITDFDIDDTIYVDGIMIGDPDAFPAGMTGVEGANGYELHYGAGDVITLAGVSAAQFYDWARINVTGTTADETIAGRSNSDAINGAGGNDILLGNAGRDTLHGNDGADYLDGGGDHDVLYGDAGDDVLIDSADGNDQLFGGAGNDTLDGGSGHDMIDGGTGDDTLTGAEGRDSFVFVTGDGIDTITDFDPANDTLRIDGATISDLAALPTGVTGASAGNDFELSYGTGDRIVILSSAALVAAYPDLFGAADDVIAGTAGDDVIDGGRGNDTLTGGDGNDVFAFDSGDGNDVVTDFTAGSDSLLIDGVTVADLSSLPTGVAGATSADGYVLSYGSGDSILIRNTPALAAAWPDLFSNPDEVITGTSGRDTLMGGIGNDQIDSLGDNDQLYGGEGNDTLTSASGNNNMYGEAGDDVLIAGNGHDQLTGGAGDDSLTGGSGRNTFHFATGDGVDVITDFDIDDTIYVDGIMIGDPDAFPAGMTGVEGANGYELHYGAGDVITLTGVSAAQFYDWARINVTGTAGDETISGRSNSDAINGAGGDDILLGNGGRDTLHGNDGADYLDGGGDHDVLYGDAGDDVLIDSADGNDQLYGGAGNDVIDGGNGHDMIDGGTGDDILTGSEGRDTFVFRTGDGIDTITDFDLTNDKIKLAGTGLSYAGLVITDGAEGAEIALAAGDMLLLNGVLASQLTESQFMFA